MFLVALGLQAEHPTITIPTGPVFLQNNAYLLGTCNYWCDKACSAYEVLSGVHRQPVTSASTELSVEFL